MPYNDRKPQGAGQEGATERWLKAHGLAYDDLFLHVYFAGSNVNLAVLAVATGVMALIIPRCSPAKRPAYPKNTPSKPLTETTG